MLLRSRAEAELASLPDRVAARVRVVIDRLCDEPRPPGAERIHGIPDGYRVRVGDYRVVYTVAHAVVTVFVIRIGHRRDVYRNL